MTFSPITEARIRDIQGKTAARRDRREEEAARLAERQANEEQRSCLSPNDILARDRAKANWDYWQRIYEQDQAREKAERRSADIKKMAAIKADWEKPENTATRRGYLVHEYRELYRRYVPKTTDEMLLAAWQEERLKAMRKKVYGATK